jgi:transposase
MAFLQGRVSRGIKYWSIVESRWKDGKSIPHIIEYLGTADTILQKLKKKGEHDVVVKTYCHGDTNALLNIAVELDIINIINKYIPLKKDDNNHIRDDITVGSSFLLAAIGRACQPTSKMGWYNWCKTTSLEYSLKSSFMHLDSQHFWDQMNFLDVENISKIEEEIVNKIIKTYDIKLDCLLYDTTNFFTFIDSQNNHCTIPRRGKNKQKRLDLRQIGLALLVTRKDQYPLFHKTYQGNHNDITTFQEVFKDFVERLKSVTNELTDITLVFDKGNNSKDNFKMIDEEESIHYVGGLVSSYFKEMILEANKNFSTILINGEEVPVYRIKKEIWGEERTCVITVSEQLKEGQIQGIHQHLEKKYKILSEFKKQLESPSRRKIFKKKEIKSRIEKIIKGQFIEDILKYEFIKLNNNDVSFTYCIDDTAFDKLKKEVLGRRILVTNRHEWTEEEIILAYRGQSKIEYVFKNIKNPYHLAIRPQYHWTDQKIEVHMLICLIGYILTISAFNKAKNLINYKKNINNFMNDLKQIRLAVVKEEKDKNNVKYKLEEMSDDILKLANTLSITNENIRPKINFSV